MTIAFRFTQRVPLWPCLALLLGCWITLLSSIWSYAQAAPHRIGVLITGPAYQPVFDGLREGLAQLGYHEGKQLTFIVASGSGVIDNLPAKAQQLVAAQPEVLCTITTAATAAALQATHTIPIVFSWVGDPVRSGFIASFASSKNNATGVAITAAELSGKRLEILLEIAPQTKRVLAVVPSKEIVAQLGVNMLRETAVRLGVEVIRRDVVTVDDLTHVLEETSPGSVDGIVLISSAFSTAHSPRFIAKAKADRIPLIGQEEILVRQGALASYGADYRLIGLQAAKSVAKILTGAKPADLPTQLPDTFVFALNLTTAKAIGLTLPTSVVERAERLIEE